MRKLRPSLATKWLAFQIIGFSLILCLVGLYQYYSIRAATFEDIRNSGAAVSRSIKEMLTERPELFTNKTLQPVLARLATNVPDIDRISIIDHLHHITADSKTTAVRHVVDEDKLRPLLVDETQMLGLLQERGIIFSQFEKGERKYLRLSETIEGPYDSVRKNNIVGVLTIDLHLSRAEQVVAAKLKQVILFMAGLLFMFWAIQYAFMRRGFLRWLRLLTAAAERFGKGEFSARANVTSNDELGQLAGAFNQMATEVEQSDLALKAEIDERQRIENELLEARDTALESTRLKSEFLANMSHEIRTPMNGVIGMTGLLLDTELNAEQQEFAETIRFSGDALLTIINDILDFSKMEAGKLNFETLDFDLSNAIESTLELLAARAHGKGLELASLIPSDVPTGLRGDPGRLRQVLTNLIGNAIKFTQRGEVIVRAEKEEGTDNEVAIRFSVSDTGIGISEASQQNLFQAFTQADGSTTRKYGGTGLGLAISKQLVELMGGQIGVNSVVGEGSTFWFTARFDKQVSQQVAVQPELRRLTGLHALIVDDNSTNRKILSHQLSSWDMVNNQAESGTQALELLKAAAARGEPYDLVVLDLLMPGMDGYALAEAIKADSSISRARLVLLTSGGRDGARSRAAGISASLSKPVRQSQFFDCLSSVMSTSISGADDLGRSTLANKPGLPEPKKMSDKLILLAEDNIVNQKVAIRQLQKLGYRADAVANGREAIEALRRIPYDLVFMDCQMPEMDGYEATAEIRRSEADRKHTPIVAVTAHALDRDRKKCIGAGMDDYITKPVKVEELRRVLNAFLETAKEENYLNPIDDCSPIDVERMHEAMGDEPEEFAETLNLYLEDMSKNFGQLETALTSGDRHEIESLAHNCAGTSANCGMNAVVGSLRELEDAAREGDLSHAPFAFAQAKQEFARIGTFLNQHH